MPPHLRWATTSPNEPPPLLMIHHILQWETTSPNEPPHLQWATAHLLNPKYKKMYCVPDTDMSKSKTFFVALVFEKFFLVLRQFESNQFFLCKLLSSGRIRKLDLRYSKMLHTEWIGIYLILTCRHWIKIIGLCKNLRDVQVKMTIL